MNPTDYHAGTDREDWQLHREKKCGTACIYCQSTSTAESSNMAHEDCFNDNPEY